MHHIINLHPTMAAWLVNELQNNRFECASDEDEAVLSDTLAQLQNGSQWVGISDAHIRHVWASEQGEELFVSPDSYAYSGTPVDAETGDDLTYVRTEVAHPLTHTNTSNEEPNLYYVRYMDDDGNSWDWYINADGTTHAGLIWLSHVCSIGAIEAPEFDRSHVIHEEKHLPHREDVPIIFKIETNSNVVGPLVWGDTEINNQACAGQIVKVGYIELA